MLFRSGKAISYTADNYTVKPSIDFSPSWCAFSYEGPSSMILRILTWESRTTPRHYFQRAVLYRTALCFLPEAHPHRGHPSLSPGPAQALPAVSPPSLGSPPPSSFCFLRLYAPVRSIIGVSFSPLPFSRKPYRFARQRPRKTSE